MSSETHETAASRAAGTQDPLDVILAAHATQRVACAQLEQAAALGVVDAMTADALRRYLTELLPLHWQDEEHDLFPLLRRRAQPEDAIATALSRLAHDHEASAAATVTLARALDRMTHAEQPDTETRAAMRAFADRERRHLAFENAVILPLARLRLTETDRETLHLSMQRRYRDAGLPFP
jgi:iron-sulfur cluster repair protein YtfE (RIC family)